MRTLKLISILVGLVAFNPAHAANSPIIYANGCAYNLVTQTCVPANAGGGAVWGNLTGTLSNQIDLQNALNAKQSTLSTFTAPLHQWISSFTAPNTFASTQPAFTDISGTVAAAQMLALTNTHIYVGNGSNQPADVAAGGDLSLANTGAFTVGTVGTSSAANIHNAELAANAATNANTVSTIVKRDGSGNFSAGTITASLTGHASLDEPTITAGLATQYWRGDKTFQLLDTSAVPENGNLYFTNTRAIAAPLTGFSAAAGVVAATDTILQGFNKLVGNATATQAYGTFLGGPVSGAAATPSFKSVSYPTEYWTHSTLGSDVIGDGSFSKPWKTVAFAATQIAGNCLLHLSGFFPYDQSAGPISWPANCSMSANYPGFQISQPITITGGGGNDNVTMTNVTSFSTLDWIRNDAGALSIFLVGSEFDDVVTFKQTGAGKAGTFLWARGSVLGGGLDVILGQVTAQGGALYGAVNYEDSGTAYFNVFSSDIAATFSLNGGLIATFTGSNVEAGTTITTATTGSGTPSITTDSSGIPSSIVGPGTITLNSFAQYVGYSPATPGNWAPAPTKISTALDQLAARPSGAGTVTSASVVSANGLAGTVATATTTPAITLSTTVTGILKGNGTAISAAVSGTDYQPAGNYVTSMTGEATGAGPGATAVTLSNAAVIGKVLTGFVSGAGAVAATDSILAAFNKIVGNQSLYCILTGCNMSGQIDMGGNQVVNAADPTTAQALATRAYVDQVAANGVAKAASVYATTAALPANTYNNGASGVGATITEVGVGALSIDGNAPSVGQRVLIKNEVAQANDGIYTVTVAGSGIAAFVLTRAADFNQASDIVDGATTYITSGTSFPGNQNTTWQLDVAGAVTVGTTALVFNQIAGPGAILAGNGLSITGSTISLSAPVSIANGGTNSGTALSNNRVMKSSGGAIVEAAAITASRALVSDANGIPVASAVTDTTLGFLDATSSVQTQINSKQGILNVVTKTANYTAVANDVVRCDASGGAFTITFPAAVSNVNKIIKTKKVDSSSNNCNLAPNGADTLEYNASQALTTKGQAANWISNGVDGWESF